MFNSILGSTLDFGSICLCLLTSIVLGIFIAFIHMKTSKYSKNFVITLSVLPTLVMIVMLMVNGNLGTSVAILGAFSLIRFRSIPGNSKKIASVFFAMAIGLATGMGQVLFALVITIIVGILLLILQKSSFGNNFNEKLLKIMIPENLDYTTVFDDEMHKYCSKSSIDNVKTTNMGSMFEITYRISLLKDINEKEFIDSLRIKNGNLRVSISHNIDGELL